MEFVDDRDSSEKKSHYYLWGGTDSFMSGWGLCEHGNSYAFWACRPKDHNKVERWVRQRGDIKRVRQVAADYKPSSSNCGHCHIYVIRDGHPALD